MMQDDDAPDAATADQRLRLADRTLYSIWSSEILRVTDIDQLGHVNNAVHPILFEGGRAALFNAERDVLRGVPGCDFVVARFIIDYLNELTWPGTVAVGTAVIAIGRSSFTFGQAMYRDDTVIATAKTVVVLLDRALGRSRPIPDWVRARLMVLRGGPDL